MTKTESLNSRNLLYHSLGGLMSKIKRLRSVVPTETSSLSGKPPILCLHEAFCQAWVCQ
jgi:hypothetical protein